MTMKDIKKQIENGKVEIPEGFRLLGKSELIQACDFFTTPAMDDWKVTAAKPGTKQNPFAQKAYYIRRRI
jgi:hypothetical protein